jgi:glycosyltransferase involved in cell wall biosynthesis
MKIREKKNGSKKKIACIFNYPPHYRENIFLKMEENLDCDFYFGNIEEGNIKKINNKLFKTSVKYLKTKKLFHNFNWISGMTSVLFKKHDYYILTADPFILSNWIFLILNMPLKKKVYLWGHGWYGREGKLKRLVKLIFFKLSDGVFLYGNYAKNLMESEGIDSNKLHVIYNSLNYDLQLKIRNSLKPSGVFKDFFKNDNPVLIFTGRLTKVKNIDLLIESHDLLNKKGIKLNVFILGDGSEKQALEALVKTKGLKNNYWFFGACYDEQKIGEFYFNAHVCVSPGNVGLTGIHSLTYGCPVITHNNFTKQMPEFEAIENLKTGCFFKEDDVEDLSNCIQTFLKESLNRDVVRQNCFKVIDKYYNPNYQIKLLNKIINNKE